MNKLGKLYCKILKPRFSSVGVLELKTKKKKKPSFILLATLQDFIAKRRKIFNNYYFGHFIYLLTNGLQIQFRVALYYYFFKHTSLGFPDPSVLKSCILCVSEFIGQLLN